jgi:hypothetical protein
MSGLQSDKPENGKPEIDLGPLRKIYEIASRVLKLGRRWHSAQFSAGPLTRAGEPWSDTATWLLATFLDANHEDLFGFRATHLASSDVKGLIDSNRPLSDAVRYLEYASIKIREVASRRPTAVEDMAVAIKALEVARDIFGEVLDDLEEEENPILIPVWDREAKQLWYGEILCREYRKVAGAQFQILDLFQAREWLKTVPSPWRDEKKLRDTVGHMNDGHSEESPIRFEVFNMKPSWF